jgi:predicted SAM-dependent methyltransferase
MTDPIASYLAGPGPYRLQLGCGATELPGWLGTDVEPSGNAVFLDACAPFPLPDASFDLIYGEHMIEHLSWEDGQRMLAECQRVLRPGGRLRLATPDLAVILGLYNDSGATDGQAYVRWISDTFLGGAAMARPAFVINNAFHNWGHRFLYDRELLELALERAGFHGITACAYGESSEPLLCGVETHHRHVNNGAMVQFETMIVEAIRPSPA